MSGAPGRAGTVGAMTVPNDLPELERAMWRAMVAGPDEAVAFYDEVLADRVLMLFPGGMVIDDRQQVVDSMRSVGWDSYELSDERVFDLGESSAVVAYRGVARRGADEYEALFNSTYVRRGDSWALALHQQTPT